MKKIISLLIVCGFAVTMFAGCSANNTTNNTGSNTTVNTKGNTNGNIDNFGQAALQGDWIYYTDFLALYKIKTDGTGKTKLSDGSAFFINVVGDWIYYYSDSTDGGTYKIKTDGTGKTKLEIESPGYSVSYINVVGDWIYFTSFDGEASKIYKVKTDGTAKTMINNDNSSFINVVGDWIYYSVPTFFYSNGVLYKIKTDGTGRSRV